MRNGFLQLKWKQGQHINSHAGEIWSIPGLRKAENKQMDWQIDSRAVSLVGSQKITHRNSCLTCWLSLKSCWPNAFPCPPISLSLLASLAYPLHCVWLRMEFNFGPTQELHAIQVDFTFPAVFSGRQYKSQWQKGYLPAVTPLARTLPFSISIPVYACQKTVYVPNKFAIRWRGEFTRLHPGQGT